MRSRTLLTLPCLLLTLATGLACDKASPVVPDGATLVISVSPSRINSATGSATVSAIVRRANGAPINPGSEVRFSTTLGVIDESALTDSNGAARATLQGDGRIGMATVTASAGAIPPVMLMVDIGTSAGAASLQANPSSIPENGGVIRLLVLVRDDKGQPLPNALINFSSPVGKLGKGGAFQRTDSDGHASDSLTLTSTDVSTLTTDNFDVSVEVSSGAATALTDTFRVAIQRAPRADFSFVASRATSTVAFTDTSSPRPTSWDWDFGDGTAHSTQQNPNHQYSSVTQTYLVTLKAKNSVGEGTITKAISFPSQ